MRDQNKGAFTIDFNKLTFEMDDFNAWMALNGVYGDIECGDIIRIMKDPERLCFEMLEEGTYIIDKLMKLETMYALVCEYMRDIV
jgi:hypothetical protein